MPHTNPFAVRCVIIDWNYIGKDFLRQVNDYKTWYHAKSRLNSTIKSII